MIDAPQDEQRRAFLERRQQGIGASDAAAVLGLSPWGTPLSVYESKVNPADDAPTSSLPAWLGLRLEDVVVELFTARTGLKSRSDNRHHVHPEDPWLVCHLDYRVLGAPEQIIECKTQRDRHGWGEENTDEVPVYYWVQAQHELLVTGASVVHMPVLFGLYDFKTFRIERDEAFFARWRAAARSFWENNVQAGVPPPLEGDEFSRRLVAARWPNHDQDLKRLPPEMELPILQLRDSYSELKALEKHVAALENRIKDLIGEAAGVEGGWGKITWKQIKDRTITEWQQVADVYRVAIQEILDNLNPGDDEQAVRVLAAAQSALEVAVSLYTRVEPGHRRINIQFRKDN